MIYKKCASPAQVILNAEIRASHHKKTIHFRWIKTIIWKFNKNATLKGLLWHEHPSCMMHWVYWGYCVTFHFLHSEWCKTTLVQYTVVTVLVWFGKALCNSCFYNVQHVIQLLPAVPMPHTTVIINIVTVGRFFQFKSFTKEPCN